MAKTHSEFHPQSPYKVFTALLTQNGGDDPLQVTVGDPLTIGVTYFIDDPASGDFTNVGAPNNNINTSFVATGTTPNSWGGGAGIFYNGGAPVVTVLENTIGNIWFTYSNVGTYSINSDGLFTLNKTMFSITLIGNSLQTVYVCLGIVQDPNICQILTGDISTSLDNVLTWKSPIEIRVYS
ncbi:MAG: hypothetical protein WCK31_05085 [bacterium]